MEQTKLLKTKEKTFTPIELILVIILIIEIITSYVMFPIIMCVAKETLMKFILFTTIIIFITAILIVIKRKNVSGDRPD